MNRRSLLKGGAAAILSVPVAGAPVHAMEDDHLLSLWRDFLDTDAQIDALDRQAAEAIAKMPTWARWDDSLTGLRRLAPEWRPAIRKRNSVPDDFPLRPLEEDIKALNKKLVYEAVGRWIEENYPADVIRGWVGAGLSEELLKARVAAQSAPSVIAEKERGEARLLDHVRQYCNQHRWEKKVGLRDIRKEQDKVVDVIYDLKWSIIDAPHASSVGMLIRLRVFVYQKTEQFSRLMGDLDSDDQFIIRMVYELERSLLRDAAALIPPFPKLDAYMQGVAA